MIIRATDEELDLCGTPAELRAVALALTRLSPGECRTFPADQSADPAPYARLLHELRVEASSGPARLVVAGDRLLATGAAEMLSRFGSFFDFPDDAVTGTHTHHDWYPDNPYIAPDSRPLVISVQAAKQP